MTKNISSVNGKMFILVKGSSGKGKVGTTQTDCQCLGFIQLERLKHRGKAYSMEDVVVLAESNISGQGKFIAHGKGPFQPEQLKV